MRSSTWKNNQENHDYETCLSKKYDWWDIFVRNEIKKKTMNDDKNFSETEKNNYFVNEEKKLMQNCYFDYQETVQTAAKKQ